MAATGDNAAGNIMWKIHRDALRAYFFPALWIASFVNNFLVITGTSNYFGVVLKGV